MEKEKVKSDLRKLRKITHRITVGMDCKQNHERRRESALRNHNRVAKRNGERL